jgi:hypothetical protein
MTPPDSEEAAEFTVGCNGGLYCLVDPKKTVVYADIGDAVLRRRQRNLQRALLPDFVADHPREADLGVEKTGLKETVEIGAEASHQIRVIQSETRKVIWFDSARDFFPRRAGRIYKRETAREEGNTRLLINDLQACPTPDLALLNLAVPPGYTKMEDFAPQALCLLTAMFRPFGGWRPRTGGARDLRKVRTSAQWGVRMLQ